MKNITIEKEGDGKFIAKFAFDYETKDIVKSAGFKFDGTRKYWYTFDEKLAEKFQGEDVIARLNTEAEEKHRKAVESVKLSHAVDAAISVPAPKGLNYLGYQIAGIAYALSHPNVLIGDEMGLGKTIQTIGMINADETINNVLIICPASLKINWMREIIKWCVKEHLSIEIASNGYLPKTDIVIANYEIIGSIRSAIDNVDWDILVCDECHYLKNNRSQRTKNILGNKKEHKLGIAARRVIMLSGTPIVNRPKELWPILERLDPNGLGSNFMQFHKRYCNAHHNGYGWDFNGAANLDELQEKLRASCMIRRLKDNVLTDLPAKQRQVITLPSNGASQAIADELALWERSQGRLDELRAAVELAKVSEYPEDYEHAVRALKAARQVSFEEIAKVRHKTALAKVPYMFDHLNECLEGGNKIVFFCHHLDIARAIAAEFKAPMITGEITLTQRQKAVDQFQTDPKCRLVVCTIRAAGVGLTLTASSHVIFGELDWVPGNLCQAEDRCHRIGQRNSVLVQHLVLDGSLDARMADILIEKQAIIEKALNNDETVSEYRPIAEPEEEEAPQYTEVATAAAKPEDITKEAAGLMDEEVKLIHTCLQALAGMCDGAISLDGAGFNKIDAYIGKSLASSSRLSQKQAALGKRIIRKYHRQLPANAMTTLFGITR